MSQLKAIPAEALMLGSGCVVVAQQLERDVDEWTDEDRYDLAAAASDAAESLRALARAIYDEWAVDE